MTKTVYSIAVLSLAVTIAALFEVDDFALPEKGTWNFLKYGTRVTPGKPVAR